MIEHSYRQSTLGDLDICAERGRLTLRGEMPHDNKDASSVGTAVHAGIEYGLIEMKDGRGCPPLRELVGVALQEWEHLQEAPEFQWIKFKKPGSADEFIHNSIEVWHTQVMPEMRPIAIEHTFKDLPLYEDDERRIVLNGTIDLVDERWGCVDWKTSGDDRRYAEGFGGSGWEKKRWAIQPTVYTYAAAQLGLIETTDVMPFTYFVFARQSYNKAILQELRVERHAGDWEWLKQKTIGISKLEQANLAEWPKNDNHALCSEAWCPAWDQCKGQNYQAGWPKPSKPKETT